MSAIALILFLVEVPAEPATVRETFDYYEVTGSTAADLRTSLDRNGPKKNAGGRVSAGWTKWDVEWSYLWTTTSDECRLTRVSTTLTLTTTLPRWSSADHPGELSARWNRFLEALRAHEDGHARNGHDATRVIGERLRALPPEPDCPALAAAIQKAAEAALAEYRARDVSYDLRTAHGLTQGAAFP
jgi:predicted secreted Zn-dependent protease